MTPPTSAFLHFVDDEVITRIGSDRVGLLPKVERLICLLAFASPEPPLFPMSARHELEGLRELTERLFPLFESGYVRTVGAGVTPQAYLSARRGQYESAVQYPSPLFDPSEDRVMDRYSDSWVMKPGSSTAAIADRWEGQLLTGDPELLALIQREAGGSLPDSKLGELFDLPTSVAGMPLIPTVVARALSQRGITRQRVSRALGEALVAHLVREWARVYRDPFDAVVLCDLGSSLPPMNAFLPPRVPTVSGRRIETMLDRLGVRPILRRLSPTTAATVWKAIEPARVLMAEDLWVRATRSGPIWERWELARMKDYDRRMASRSFALRTQRRIARAGRLAIDLDKRCTGYLDTVVATYPSTSVIAFTSIDRSINIGEVHGNPQIASGEFAALNQAVQGTLPVASSVAQSLAEALASDAATAQFTAVIRELPLAVSEDDAAAITAEVSAAFDGSLDDPSRRKRAETIVRDLSTSAGGSMLAMAILTGLKALGL